MLLVHAEVSGLYIWHYMGNTYGCLIFFVIIDEIESTVSSETVYKEKLPACIEWSGFWSLIAGPGILQPWLVMLNLDSDLI